MTKHFGYVDKDAVTIDCWLTIDPGDARHFHHQRRPSVRVSAGEPALARGERAINLKMALPLALFETPNIIARIAVESPTTPVTIDTTAVADAVKQVIGMDIQIEVNEQPRGN